MYAAVVMAVAADNVLISAVAWTVVAAATVAATAVMINAFGEAKSTIDRRQTDEQTKQQKEQAKKQKLKEMFERL